MSAELPQDPIPAVNASRHEFKVVIDGLELTDEQRDQITLAIQKAGIEAVRASTAQLQSPAFIAFGDLKLPRRPWPGLIVVNGRPAEELGQGIDRILPDHLRGPGLGG